MKLKCTPEDFAVTELTDRAPGAGRYALYQLDKQSIGTLEAIQTIQRQWNLAPGQISHGGLKDRHAATRQFVTIRNGPRADIDNERVQLRYLGATPTAYGAADVQGNRFEIVVRSLSIAVAADICARENDVRESGYLNYFDDQRFGSLGAANEFVAAYWCHRNYERALWLAVADHNAHDDAAEREQKRITRDLWGQWKDCKAQLGRSHRRSIITYLVDHPTGFRKAFALLNTDLRGLFLSAFQSAVWNRMLGLTVTPSDDRMLHVGDADLPFPQSPSSAAEELPLPSVRCKGLTSQQRLLCDQSLVPYGMQLVDMKISFPRDRWFSRAQRSTIIVPHELSGATEDDERYPGRRKVTLKFTLPRGCYATMLLKSLTDRAAKSDLNDSSEVNL